MRRTLITLFITLSLFTHAQKSDLTGTWIGTSTFLKEHTQLKYELKQQGDKITGFLYAKNLDKKDSIKASVKGVIKKGVITLEGDEIIYRTGMACMAKNELTYLLNNGKETLTGKWRGDMKLNTCPPMVSGTVTLFREEPTAMVTVAMEAESSPTKTIASEDGVGKALVTELGKRKYFALIIGINDYQDENIQNLDNPINDAEQLAGVLTYHYSFDQENVNVLENPRREDIIKALDELTNKVTEKDNLLIFYAGHGIWNEQLNQGYWLPSDASMDSKSYWLSNSTLRDYVGGINSKHTLLISDACFSGGILKERAVFENSRAILEVYKLTSRKAMTSGTLKTVPDESVFIEYLLKNLVNNQAPLLSADQLFRHFKTAVINNSPNGQVPQYGPISQAGDEGGDFIFLKRNQ
ncbi:caspase domain-containing protein [Ekhidna sp.]|uniref:caspase family protein n=1 Tax=Ekhidna sp. TaxID=2608089 RepID=UPI003518E21C